MRIFKIKNLKILEQRDTALTTEPTEGSRRVASQQHIQRSYLDSTVYGVRLPSCFWTIRALITKQPTANTQLRNKEQAAHAESTMKKMELVKHITGWTVVQALC